MSISMYQAFVPPIAHALDSLADILGKIAAHCEARKIDPTVLLNARLFPDMFPLSRQVQIASDMSKGCAARLAGQEPPSWEDNESSIPDLIARVRKTIDYIKSFSPQQIDGSEERDVVLKMRTGERHFKGQAYLSYYVLPNVYFHITTAYAIARSNGVELGKTDYLGAK